MNSIKHVSHVSFLALSLLLLIASCTKKEPSVVMNDPRNIRGVISYKRSFGDLHNLHLLAARKNGIREVSSRSEAEGLKNKLVEIKSNKVYVVDELTHSIPYLVPQASNLLETIGGNFLDSLKNKGLNPNLVRVTSVLRTHDDVKDLRKTNINASSLSAHLYGATFDISYNRFAKVEEHPDGNLYQDVSSDTLKLVLAEVLRDLRKADMCYIKYELKQGCFHITAR